MATQTQIINFINQIAPCAKTGYKTLGKILPSVCIGMACVESAYGTAGSCKYHSYLGQKVGSGKTATKYWSGGFFTSKTSEEYTVGVHTVIHDAFRTYENMQQCVLNYYELLNTSLYGKVLAGVDYKTQMAQIKACGYMTSSTEVNSVISIVGKYNLTQYDREVLPLGSIDTGNAAEKQQPINGNPYTEPTNNVRLNSKGNDVRWVQYELNCRGYKLIVDGIAGNLTIGAVMDFQNKNGLAVDGIVGKDTRSKLKA